MIIRICRLAVVALVALATVGHAQVPTETLSAHDVRQIIDQGAAAAAVTHTNCAIAVTDREGFVLGVYDIKVRALVSKGGLQVTNAISKAGTAAFLSSNGDAFTTRTAAFIIQDHFPPGISNTGVGPLFGVGLSSLPFSDINHFYNPLHPGTPTKIPPGIANTSLSGNPGGVPLYKNGVLVGGVGVDSTPGTGLLSFSALNYVPGTSVDEDLAVTAQSGYAPPASILATQILINGIRLPYTSFGGGPVGFTSVPFSDYSSSYPNPPIASTGKPAQTIAPSPFVPPNFKTIPGEVRNPIIDSPQLHTNLVNGQKRLSKEEVTTILYQAALRASTTRAAIRSPIGPAQVFIVVVDYYQNPSKASPPAVLGSFRTTDATIFSYDVAAQKARTALFFSNNSMALSSRTVGFLAQDTFPPGIDGTTPGPYGYPAGPLFPNSNTSLQSTLSLGALPNLIPLTPINKFLPNGITIFPGGFPLYRNGVLIGAVGISGDGVDQDDLISASATVGFEAPTSIRADEFTFRGARLPYAKFPQNASL